MLRGQSSSSSASQRTCVPLSPTILQAATIDGKAGPPHVATFDPTRLVWPDHILGFFSIVDLSVFCDPYIWVWSAAVVGVSVAVGLIAGAEGLDDDWLRAASTATSALGTVVAFVIGGFLALVVSTWRSRRTAYASLIGASRNLLIQLSTIVSTAGITAGREHAAEVTAARARMGRYVLLACELAYAKARGKMDADATLAALKSGGLLADGEWEAMARGDRHTTVYCWIQAVDHQ